MPQAPVRTQISESEYKFPDFRIATIWELGERGRLVRTIKQETSSFVYDSFKMRNWTHE